MVTREGIHPDQCKTAKIRDSNEQYTDSTVILWYYCQYRPFFLVSRYCSATKLSLQSTVGSSLGRPAYTKSKEIVAHL